MLFDGAPVPRDGVITPRPDRPGHGLTLKIGMPMPMPSDRASHSPDDALQRQASCRTRTCRGRPSTRWWSSPRWRGGRLLTWFAAGRSKPLGLARCRSYVAGARCHCERGAALNHASTMLAASVLFDSGLEHYRGQFFNRAMYTPIVVSSVTLAGVPARGWRHRPGSSRVRHGVQALAGLTGLIGFGFHAYNVGKREGGYSFQNLFYSAPIGAPMALTLAGVLGVVAERVRDADPTSPASVGCRPGVPWQSPRRACSPARPWRPAASLPGCVPEPGDVRSRHPAAACRRPSRPRATKPEGASQAGAKWGMWRRCRRWASAALHSTPTASPG